MVLQGIGRGDQRRPPSELLDERQQRGGVAHRRFAEVQRQVNVGVGGPGGRIGQAAKEDRRHPRRRGRFAQGTQDPTQRPGAWVRAPRLFQLRRARGNRNRLRPARPSPLRRTQAHPLGQVARQPQQRLGVLKDQLAALRIDLHPRRQDAQPGLQLGLLHQVRGGHPERRIEPPRRRVESRTGPAEIRQRAAHEPRRAEMKERRRGIPAELRAEALRQQRAHRIQRRLALRAQPRHAQVRAPGPSGRLSARRAHASPPASGRGPSARR